MTVERIGRYLALKARDRYSAASRNGQLNVLSLILKAAARRHLIPVNPVASIKRPKEPKREWRILSPSEVVAIERAFDGLITEAERDGTATTSSSFAGSSSSTPQPAFGLVRQQDSAGAASTWLIPLVLTCGWRKPGATAGRTLPSQKPGSAPSIWGGSSPRSYSNIAPGPPSTAMTT